MAAGDLNSNSRPNVPRVYIRKPSSAAHEELNAGQEPLQFNYPPPSSVRRKKHLSPVRAINDRRTSTTSPHGFLRHPLARKNSMATRRLPSAPPPPPPKIHTRRPTLSKRLEIALDKFTQVALPCHLNHIYRHKKNIERLQHLGDWGEVSREVNRATKTVHQLGVLLFEIEILRTYVEERELNYFDERVNPAKTSALVAVHGLQEMCPVNLMSSIAKHEQSAREEEKGASANAITYCSNPLYNDGSATEGRTGEYDYGNRSLSSSSRAPTTGTLEVLYEDPKEDSVSMISTLEEDDEGDERSHLLASASCKNEAKEKDSKAKDLESRKETFKAWNLLHEEIKDLQELISEFSPAVSRATRRSKPPSTTHRSSHLSSTAIYPVAGALLGTCLGGPVGFLAGVKIGGLAAIGGSVFGYSTGIVIKEQIDRQDYIDEFYAHRSRSQRLQTPPSISTASSQILTDPQSGRKKAPPLRDRTQSLPDVYINKSRIPPQQVLNGGRELSRSRSVRTRHIPPTRNHSMALYRCNSTDSTTSKGIPLVTTASTELSTAR